MARKRSNDPVTAATTSYLWPYLKEKGFVKSTARNFAREINGFFQQIWIDANGFSGKSSVRVHYNVMPIAEENVSSYSVGDGIDSWDMSDHEKADISMQEIIEVIDKDLIPKMDSYSNFESYVYQFREYGCGIEEYKNEMLERMSRWVNDDFKSCEKDQASENRKKLKL